MKSVKYTQILGKQMVGKSIKDAVKPEVYNRHVAGSLSSFDKIKYDEMIGTIKKLSRKFSVYTILLMFSLLPFAIIAISIIEPLLKVGFAQAYKNAAIIFYLLIAFAVLGAVGFAVFFTLRKKAKLNLLEYTQQNGAVLDKILVNNFNLPENKMEIDYLEAYFTPETGITKGKITAYTADFYYDDNNLYYVDGDTLIKIPKSEMLHSEIAEEKTVFFSGITNNINSKEYRACGIRAVSNSGHYMCKSYGIFVFNDGKETYSIEVLPNSYEKLRALFGR